jgi:hypothetical protein
MAAAVDDHEFPTLKEKVLFRSLDRTDIAAPVLKFLIQVLTTSTADLTDMDREVVDLGEDSRPLRCIPDFLESVRAVEYALLGMSTVEEVRPNTGNRTVKADVRFAPLRVFLTYPPNSPGLDDATFVLYRALFESNHTVATKENSARLRRMIASDDAELHSWFPGACSVRLQVLALRFIITSKRAKDMTKDEVDALLITIMVCAAVDVPKSMEHLCTDIEANTRTVSVWQLYVETVYSIQRLAFFLGITHARDEWITLFDRWFDPFLFFAVHHHLSNKVDGEFDLSVADFRRVLLLFMHADDVGTKPGQLRDQYLGFFRPLLDDEFWGPVEVAIKENFSDSDQIHFSSPARVARLEEVQATL